MNEHIECAVDRIPAGEEVGEGWGEQGAWPPRMSTS